jgi:hypothetical protein
VPGDDCERRSAEVGRRRRSGGAATTTTTNPGARAGKSAKRIYGVRTYAEVYIPFSYATATFSFSSVRIRWEDFIVEDFFHVCFTYLRDFYQLVRVINRSFSRDRKQFFSSFFFKSDNQPS